MKVDIKDAHHFLKFCLLICLQRVLAAACRIFSCGRWTLQLPYEEAEVSVPGPAGKSLKDPHCYLTLFQKF